MCTPLRHSGHRQLLGCCNVRCSGLAPDLAGNIRRHEKGDICDCLSGVVVVPFQPYRPPFCLRRCRQNFSASHPAGSKTSSSIVPIEIFPSLLTCSETILENTISNILFLLWIGLPTQRAGRAATALSAREFRGEKAWLESNPAASHDHPRLPVSIRSLPNRTVFQVLSGPSAPEVNIQQSEQVHGAVELYEFLTPYSLDSLAVKHFPDILALFFFNGPLKS